MSTSPRYLRYARAGALFGLAAVAGGAVHFAGPHAPRTVVATASERPLRPAAGPQVAPSTNDAPIDVATGLSSAVDAKAETAADGGVGSRRAGSDDGAESAVVDPGRSTAASPLLFGAGGSTGAGASIGSARGSSSAGGSANASAAQQTTGGAASSAVSSTNPTAAQSTPASASGAAPGMPSADVPPSSLAAVAAGPTDAATPGAVRDPAPFASGASDPSPRADAGRGAPVDPVASFVMPPAGRGADGPLATSLADAPGLGSDDLGRAIAGIRDDGDATPRDAGGQPVVATSIVGGPVPIIAGPPGVAGADAAASPPTKLAAVVGVPEPGSIALVLVAGAAMLFALRRRTATRVPVRIASRDAPR